MLINSLKFAQYYMQNLGRSLTDVLGRYMTVFLIIIKRNGNEEFSNLRNNI